MKTYMVGTRHTQPLSRLSALQFRDALGRRTPPPNDYDLCLFMELAWWEKLIGESGLTKICCPLGRKRYTSRPWVQMPAEGRQFKPVGVSGTIGTLATGVDIPVLIEPVPLGYDGVITDFVCEVVASSGGPAQGGFVEGSGQVTWRLMANSGGPGRYLRDLGNIKVTMGSLVQPSPVPRGGLRVYSDDTIQFLVNINAATVSQLDPNARIVCSINGWYYAR